MAAAFSFALPLREASSSGGYTHIIVSEIKFFGSIHLQSQWHNLLKLISLLTEEFLCLPLSFLSVHTSVLLRVPVSFCYRFRAVQHQFVSNLRTTQTLVAWCKVPHFTLYYSRSDIERFFCKQVFPLISFNVGECENVLMNKVSFFSFNWSSQRW